MQVYLLEDNHHDAAYFRSCLEDRSHEVTHFERAVPLLDALHRARPGLVVLDSNVPEVDGPTALRRVRELCGTALPVAMLSCVCESRQIADVLNVGADDYLLKPMTRPVLVARLEALMRRCAPQPQTADPVIRVGPYELVFRTREVKVHGEPVVLTPKQFDLAWVLFERIDRFIPRAELIVGVWGRRAELEPHTVTQHVYVLRNKLALREHGYKLCSVYGSGYRFQSSHGRPESARQLIN
jgi:DNA-binding response OmpR family regulator